MVRIKSAKRIAFDIHGVLDDDEDLMLRRILKWAIEEKKEIFIISGPPRDQLNKELDDLGIDRNNITVISVVDWLKEKGVHMWQDEKGDWWCSKEEWWSSKGMICEEYMIDLIFDDTYRYKRYMPKSKTFAFIHWIGYTKRNKDSTLQRRLRSSIGQIMSKGIRSKLWDQI